MSINHLEELVSEWYEYQGYFVKRNIRVGKLPKGGHECELDIVAFHPIKKHLVHLEPSLDANSWATREKRFRKKFSAGKKYIPEIFKGMDIPADIDQIAILVFASDKVHKDVGGGEVIIAKDLLKDIFKEIKVKSLYSSAIPEHLIILRSFQFIAEYQDTIFRSEIVPDQLSFI